MTTEPKAEQPKQCPGANIIVSSKQFGLPPCSGVQSLLERGEPVAVVSVAHASGSSQDAYDAIGDAARAVGRESLIVRPKVRVEDADGKDWRSTVHDRDVVEILDSAPLKALCDTGVVAVCGADSAYCIDSYGTSISNVDPESLFKAINGAIGATTNVCSPSCPSFEECPG